MSSKIHTAKNDYYEYYQNDPQIIEELEEITRSKMKDDYHTEINEGIEIIDREEVECWYEYENNSLLEEELI